MSPSRALVFALIAVEAASAAAEPTPAEMTAAQLVRGATTLVEAQPLTIQALQVAAMLVEQATELTPSDAETWRALVRISDLAERGDLRARALGRLVRLDPADQVARLLYINEAIERFQTVEQRAASYEKLLNPRNRATLGPAVASRLSHDYAILLDRSGDIDGFAAWLAEAVAQDPSNRSAAATAAGFFRMNVGGDPFAEAELLTTLVLADPTSFNTQAVLAELLLDNGAYVGADRLYKIAAGTLEASSAPPAGGMLADRAVAQWGHGDVAGALQTVRRRQSEADRLHRQQLLRQDPTLSSLDLARRQAPITSTLATVRAAIHNRLGDERAGPTLDSALTSYEAEIEYLKRQQGIDPQEIIKRYLEMALIELWLGGDVQRAQGFLEAATAPDEAAELTSEARTRFEGWMALRSNDITRAVELLAPAAGSDPAARLGLALALRAEGRLGDSARELHRLATGSPGTLMGVWSADVLREVLGRTLSPSETAVRLDELVASIPSVVDRLAAEPTLALSMRLVPGKLTFDAYEPVVLNLEIANNAPFPLAIDTRGPIRPQVAILIDAQIAREPELETLRPLIVDIDRRLRLAPNERIVIPVDLRRGALAQVMNRSALRGATLKVRAIADFTFTAGNVIKPGLLGSEAESPPIRIDGVRVTGKWVSEAIADVLDPDTTQDLQTMGKLAHIVQVIRAARERAPLAALEGFGNPRQMASDATEALTEGYGKLDPVARSWVLGVIPRGADIEGVYAMARQDDNRLVRIAYLLYCLSGPHDPMIAAGKNADDEAVRLVAAMMESRIATLSGGAR